MTRKILDCHVHYGQPLKPNELLNLLNQSETDYFNLVLVPDRQFISAIVDAMIFKDIAKNRCYVFSSLDVSKYYMSHLTLGSAFKRYTKFLQKMGADGIKIIEGKPNLRKGLPIPDFDKKVWDPFWKYCEESGFPILMHLNDPEEFWDINKVPSWAKEQGWSYDKTYVNNEDQYHQMLTVLRRHPNLKIIFAHFFFMSRQLERLGKILDEFPNVMIDLTPGIEMYTNFQDDIKVTRAFFSKYQNRIIYGTDIGARAVLGNQKLNASECLKRAELVRKFLEQDQVEVHPDGVFVPGEIDMKIKGLKLEDEILEKIYYSNFVNFVGPIKKINPQLVVKEAKRLKRTIRIMSVFDKKVKKDFSNLNTGISCFQNKGE